MPHNDIQEWFANNTSHQPRAWQEELIADPDCRNRLIRIPTGMGKTLGVLAAWAFHRLQQNDGSWPRRLVWCLPMRTLVEQTTREAERIIEKAGLAERVRVHQLMGGIEEVDWFAHPEREAILIGTQDMLLSRVLNRGYAMSRAAWPRAFGLLNNDSLWVMDEVQLMGVGLTTSAQVQAFWEQQGEVPCRIAALPRATWWMSATLQPQWLRSIETGALVDELSSEQLEVARSDRTGDLWEADKPLSLEAINPTEWSSRVADLHQSHSPDPETGRQTLVVVNTVKAARTLFALLRKKFKSADSPELRLVHSRFRPLDRATWSRSFLSRSALNKDVNRIIVATQVVEAGVDISASCLVTELAPWSSLVQRFGRAARYGGRAKVVVLDAQYDDRKKSAPYAVPELDAARQALGQLDDVSIRSLEKFEDELSTQAPDQLQSLYPFNPLHVLLPREFDELFDTSPDLSGADMDVSRFIREGDERDLSVFWRNWAGAMPDQDVQPHAAELCSVPIGEAKAWVKKLTETKSRVFQWEYLDGQWTAARSDNLRPGMTLLVAATAGGYDPQLGFTGDKFKKAAESLDVVSEIVMDRTAPHSDADRADSSEILSYSSQWKTIFTHCREAGEQAELLAHDLEIDEATQRLLSLAMRLHDWGKAHPAFSKGTYRVSPERTDLAKAPPDAWRAMRMLYKTDTHGHRRGFRHELASCLATLELLRLAKPDHPGIEATHLAWLQPVDPSACRQEPTGDLVQNALTDEIASLTADDFDLLLYLLTGHHGKVRMSMQATAKDQEFDFENEYLVGHGMPIRGVREGDRIPATQLPSASGNVVELPEIELSLAPAAMGFSPRYGRSWSDRVLNLLQRHGPFQLSYLEAIVRVIDARASTLATEDAELAGIELSVPNVEHNSAESAASEHASARDNLVLADTPDDDLQDI